MIRAPGPGRDRDRGLTLLEVLIATALLAMMAAACVPVMAQAMRALQSHAIARQNEAIDLAQFADTVLQRPDLIGLKDSKELLDTSGREASWPSEEFPQQSHAPPVKISVLRAPEDTDAKHAWLVFECDEVLVHRWLPLPATEDTIAP
jgi:prepilin-type N-terminal cleavage/methylation domain-containing protein